MDVDDLGGWTVLSFKQHPVYTIYKLLLVIYYMHEFNSTNFNAKTKHINNNNNNTFIYISVDITENSEVI